MTKYAPDEFDQENQDEETYDSGKEFETRNERLYRLTFVELLIMKFGGKKFDNWKGFYFPFVVH